jgi:hypothetical protein
MDGVAVRSAEAFPDRYPTMEAAMAVAEAALGQPP